MNYKEIDAALAALEQNSALLEETYVENGGEVTEETELLEEENEYLSVLLTTEGMDTLGRYMKRKEDEKARIKAEIDCLTRQMRAAERTMDNIKFKANLILMKTGKEKVKGSLYSFTPYTSETTSVDKNVLKDMFQEKVETILRSTGAIPEDVTITLGASASALSEGAELPAYFVKTYKPTCKFIKPRANKELKAKEA